MSSPEPFINKIAAALMAYRNCVSSGNEVWKEKWEERLAEYQAMLPSGSGFDSAGSGFDSGSVIDIDASTPEKIVIHTSFHHMNDAGMYVGWTDHTITLTPSFHGFNIKVSGSNKRDIKDYISDTFYHILSEIIS